MVIGGVDKEAMLPSLAMNVQLFICRVFVKSMVKAESVENSDWSIIAPAISVAPKDASLKSHAVKLECAKQVLNRDEFLKFAFLQ